jgi:hypothetical protein
MNKSRAGRRWFEKKLSAFKSTCVIKEEKSVD